MAISPDGTRVAYRVFIEGQGTIVIRGLDELEAAPLFQNGWTPFFSPDGTWVAYNDQVDSTIKRVAVRGGGGGGGGAAQSIATIDSFMRGAAWTENDTIMFGTSAFSGLWQVPSGGGTPETLTVLDAARGETNHLFPDPLPGGEGVLFTILYEGGGETTDVAVRDLIAGEQKVLVPGGSYPKYSPTGHIVYLAGETLRAVSFDLERLGVMGDSVQVLDEVETKFTGAADFALAFNGTLIYIPGGGAGAMRTLIWLDREGNEEPLGAPPRPYFEPRVSPDGTKVVVGVRDPDGGDDIWVWDEQRATLTKLTFDAASDRRTLWTPDGSRIVFQSARDGGGIFWKASDGTDEAEPLLDALVEPYGWTPEGALLFTNGDIGLLPVTGERIVQTLIGTNFRERHPVLSPDGKWLAYSSEESGRFEVYVRPYPDVDGGKWLVSTNGGDEPVWSPTGDALFYREESSLRIMEAAVDTVTATFIHRTPEPLFTVPGNAFPNNGGSNYDLAPVGERFLFTKVVEAGGGGAGSPQIIVVQNWFTELERLVPVP